MSVDPRLKPIVDALDRNSRAVIRMAQAQETANAIAIDIEKTRREEARPDDYGRPDKPPQGILGG